MATAVLYIGWNRPHPGREGDAYRYLMTEADAALEQFQQQGFFESREHLALTAHGVGPGGFLLLFGERAKLDELRRTDAFERLAMRLGTLFSELAVVPGLNRTGIEAVMKRNPDLA